MKKWPRTVHYPCTAPWLIVFKIELLLQERRAKLQDSIAPKMWKPEEQTLEVEGKKENIWKETVKMEEKITVRQGG